MLIIVLRSVFLYILVMLSLRLMGKRQLGELQPSELVITILVSNIATLPIEDITIPMIMGVVPILTLVSLDVVTAQIILKFPKVRKLVTGTPVVIVSNGVLEQQKLKSIRYTIDDVYEAMREQQIFDISEIQYAIVETTGQISFLQKYEYRTPINSDLSLKNSSSNPKVPIIKDGVTDLKMLHFSSLGEGWLAKILEINKTEAKDVFLLTADSCGDYTIIMKDK